MNFPSYSEILFSSDLRTFQFQSEGVHGPIWKVVQYTETPRKGVFNLAFGDLLGADDLNDVIVSDNGDRDKVLATVAKTVYAFLDRYPERTVIFQGSSAGRTRLYRMAINKALDELRLVFEIKGLVRKEDQKLHLQHFEPGVNYEAFLVRRRMAVEYANPPP
jgi:hypothetical protein